MSVLEGAAVSAANGAAANGAATQGAAEAAQPAAAAAAAPAAVPAAQPAAVAEQNQVTAENNVAAVDPTLQDQVSSLSGIGSYSHQRYTWADQVHITIIQAQQIAALQGMGKAVLPRDEESSNVNKRDLASFDRALKFAEAALVKGPKVQLGTGEGGSGVGIIVDNNPTAAARVGTGAAAKRDLPSSNKVKVTTMYVRSGIPSCEYMSLYSSLLISSCLLGKETNTIRTFLTNTFFFFCIKPFRMIIR